MSVIDLKRRRLFRAQARELREIARTVKRFGLPGPTTERAVARIRRIASEIEAGQPDQTQAGTGREAKPEDGAYG